MTLETLPEAQADRLQAIYASGDRPALKAYIAALRARGWPLRAIGDPLGLPRSTVQYFENNAPSDVVVAAAIPLSVRFIENAGAKTARWRTHIPEDHRDLLRTRAADARRVRAQTPANSPLREAAERLDNLIELYLSRMVPVTEIAEVMGVTHRAVTARLERRNGSD